MYGSVTAMEMLVSYPDVYVSVTQVYCVCQVYRCMYVFTVDVFMGVLLRYTVCARYAGVCMCSQ